MTQPRDTATKRVWADDDTPSTLPHMPVGNTNRCWCGGRWCLMRERWRRDALEVIKPVFLALAFASVCGALTASILQLLGVNTALAALGGVGTVALVIAAAAVID